MIHEVSLFCKRSFAHDAGGIPLLFFPAFKNVHDQRQHKDQALDEHLPVGLHTEQIHAVRDHAQQQSPCKKEAWKVSAHA